MLTGNKAYASHVIASGGVRLAFSSPYGVATETPAAETWEPAACPNPALAPSAMHAAYAAHGLSVCAVGLVDDAAAAFAAAVAGGAKPRAPPRTACDGSYAVAEVLLYGDCSLRFVSGAALADGSLAFLRATRPSRRSASRASRTRAPSGSRRSTTWWATSPTSSPPSTTSAA